MKTEDFLTHEQSRMEVYRLLADCFHLPDENLKKKLVSLSNTLNMLCGEAAEYIHLMKKDLEQIDDFECLKVDYARLFVGPYTLSAPPYGSVYLEGERLVMGDSTLDAQKRYRNAGLDIAKDFREAPDHIAVELEFMHFLIFKEIEAATHSNIEAFGNYLIEQQSFLEDHLGAWVSDFAENITANSDTEFYKKLAKSTKIFINQELQTIESNAKSNFFKVTSSISFHGQDLYENKGIS
jgi:DMSO reductase family type II enzyme chaperone